MQLKRRSTDSKVAGRLRAYLAAINTKEQIVSIMHIYGFT